MKQGHQLQLELIENEYFESINVEGVYPSGEGAGFAGGIISAAVDGMKSAEYIIKKFNISKLS